ncbi:MAG: MaoC family dehydratase, partial [Bacteroidota bacterium]
MAHTYDSLNVGDTFETVMNVSATDVRAYADLTGDDNPIHVDAEYAATTDFGQPIAHGALLLGYISKVLGRDYPGHGSVAVSLSAKFLRPVPVDSEVTIEVRIAEKIERFGHVKAKVYVYRGG